MSSACKARIQSTLPLAIYALTVFGLTGCETMPVLTDFSEIKAEVRVPYSDMGGLRSRNPG